MKYIWLLSAIVWVLKALSEISTGDAVGVALDFMLAAIAFAGYLSER